MESPGSGQGNDGGLRVSSANHDLAIGRKNPAKSDFKPVRCEVNLVFLGFSSSNFSTARRGHGWPDGRDEVAWTGTEQTRFHSEKRGVESVCDAECDALLGDRVEVLARAVVLVAGMSIPEAASDAVLVAVAAKIRGGAVGEVVSVEFPFTDMQGRKRRPGIVLAGDASD